MNAQWSFKKQPFSKNDVRRKLEKAWRRVIVNVGKRDFAKKCGCCPATIDNALEGPGLPEAHTIFNSLLADETALDEVLALYGKRAVSIGSVAAEDLHVIAAMNSASSDWLERLLDGHRCHRDTVELAALFRPLVVRMQAIIEEADGDMPKLMLVST